MLIALSLALGLAIAYGFHTRAMIAQVVSYAAGVEGQIWQQLPTFGRGVDMGNERPITTGTLPNGPTFSTPPPLDGVADLWPCTTDFLGFPGLCYSSGIIGVGPGVTPDVMQSYGGRFAPCVGDQCYPSGLIGVEPAVTWAVGPCTMQSNASATSCYPSGVLATGPRAAPADGQLAGPLGIAVDNTPNVGTIYVTDHWNHRVQAFLFDGTVVPLTRPIGNGIAGSGPYTGEVGGRPVDGEQLSFPESIKVDASRQLLVADSGNGRVAVFDRDGNLVDSLTIFDPASTADAPYFASPTGIALTPGASFRGATNPPGALLVVSDKVNCSVYFFDATSLARLGVAGGIQCSDFGANLSFASIVTMEGVAIDNAGHVYVTDYERNRIDIFDAATYQLIGAFGDPLDGAVAPFALRGPTDVMVDHQGVYTDTDGHPVARVFVVDTLNQRIAVYKVDFAPATPAASFLFELNAAGDLNGFPTNVAEDISHDPVGKLVTTDSGNARIQRFQVPDLAVVNLVPDAATRTVFFDVVVPIGKDLVGVTSVTPIVCPTSLNTTVSSGAAAPQPGCAAARSLAPQTAALTPGQKVTYSFQFASSLNTATFDIFATGNVFNGVPQTTSTTKTATVTNTCPACAITPKVVLPGGALEDLTAPVAPSTLYMGARVYTTQLSLRVTAVSTLELAQIFYQFTSGSETANNAQPGLHVVNVSGTTASIDIPFRVPGTSVVEFWAKNADGTEIAHGLAQLTLELNPPYLIFQFNRASSSNATQANAAGWWNRPVSLPIDFSGHITAVRPLSAGMPANPPLSGPLVFATDGRNLGFEVTVTNDFGLSTTRSSNDVSTEGRPFKIDLTAPAFVVSPAITLERASFLGAPPPAAGVAQVLALATDAGLADGTAGSGVVSVAPASTVGNLPFGSSTILFTATDEAGNIASGNVTVNVVDRVAPLLTCPATVDLQAGTLGAVFGQPGFLVSDASMINAPANTFPVTVSQSPLATAALLFGASVQVTLTATDPSNNSSSCVTTATGRLLAPPQFTRVPGAQQIEAGAAPDLNVTAVDSAGTVLIVTNDRPATFPLGLTVVTFTATDAAFQTIITTVSITVVDTTRPVIAAHAPVTVEATSASGAVPGYTPPTVTDNYDAPRPATCAPAPAATFPVGTTTVTCTATDSNGNAAVATTFLVSVVDTTRPVIAPHADVTAEATSAAGAVVGYTSPSVSDIVDGPTTAACLPASGSVFALGNTTVTCKATDTHNNAAVQTTFVIHVVDTTRPMIAAHADVTVSPASAAGAIVNYTVPATTDAVDGIRSATCVPAPGTLFAIGDRTVICNATDAHGNAALPTTFVVHVIDTTAPVITACAAAVTIFTIPGTPNALPNLTSGVIATDLSGFTVTQSPAAGTLYTLASGQNSLAVPVTLTVTDGSPAHNASSCVTTVTFSAASTPVCTAASASPSVLWPPNHKLTTISISGITNADGKPVTTRVTSIFQDEPTQGLGDGDTPIDGYISTSGVAQVRAERSGLGNGRVYYLNFIATSSSGNSCPGTVSVGVPHDQAHPTIGEGPLYDSTKVTTALGDNCHGGTGHGHHDGDGCLPGHHGHYDGDECLAGDGYHHDGDGHGGGKDGGKHKK